jgi:hypothetical protein
MDTYEELRDRILVQLDILDIIEVLNITAENLLERFDDRLMMQQEDFEEYFNESTG